MVAVVVIAVLGWKDREKALEWGRGKRVRAPKRTRDRRNVMAVRLVKVLGKEDRVPHKLREPVLPAELLHLQGSQPSEVGEVYLLVCPRVCDRGYWPTTCRRRLNISSGLHRLTDYRTLRFGCLPRAGAPVGSGTGFDEVAEKARSMPNPCIA